MKKYSHQNIFIAILFFKEFSFQACDDVLNTKNYLAFRALTTMNKNQMSLGQAKKLFGLWDNAYHANGLKNLDPARRWDPTKMSKLIMKKGGESSSDEETDGMYIKFTNSIQKTYFTPAIYKYLYLKIIV